MTAPVGEVGGATLVGLALTAFVLLAGMVAVDVGALAAGRAAAQTAADLAALAALTPGAGWGASSEAGSGESRAADIASANGAELVTCDCSAVEAIVAVRRRVPLVPAALTVSLTAWARAVLAAPADPTVQEHPGWEERRRFVYQTALATDVRYRTSRRRLGRRFP